MKAQPLIAVQGVARASAWYQRVLGCRSAHGGHEYDQLVDREGRLILQLHHWDAHAHPYLGDPTSLPHGNGVLIWFQVDDFRATVSRVQAMSADVLEGPKLNPNAGHLELWLRDPDGYVVVVASAEGEV